MPGIVSASTRLPFSTRAATLPGRLELVVVDREAHLAQRLAELRARHRGRVRDEADAVPGVAQAAHRVDRAGDRLTRNVQHPVHVEQNRRHGRRVYSVGSPLPLLAVERAGRPARAEELDAGRGALRRRGLGRPQRRGAKARARPARARRARDRPGRALAAAKPRARDRADPRAGAPKRRPRRAQRRATKPTKASRERRLEEKRQPGRLKRLRRPPAD